MTKPSLFGPRPTPISDTQWQWDVPETWEQGRGAWGGLVTTALGRAIEDCAATGERTLRSLSAHIFAPVVAEPATLSARILRTGSNTQMVAVDLEQGGETRAHAIGVVAVDRTLDIQLTGANTPPIVPGWDELTSIDFDFGPSFAHHFDYRLIHGIPFTNQGGDILGYVRIKEPTSVFDASSLFGLVDAYWPATYTQVQGFRPAATMTFEAHLLIDPSTVSSSEHFLYRGRTVGAGDGYTSETRELWTEDGRLAVFNSQLVAIIK